MRKANRSTLKNFFKSGRMPKEQDFAHLIDSMLNMVDEGFDKTPRDGFKISQLGENSALISFYRPSDSQRPTWMVTCDQSSERLIIQRDEDTPALILSPSGQIGIRQPTPQHTLDVAGVIAAEGRTGKQGFAEADGQWHPIVKGLNGCHAVEVMAGVGKPNTGRYALLRATAMNTFHPGGFWTNLLNRKRSIRCQHAYYRSRCDRILLRWHREQMGEPYALELKTRSAYCKGDKSKKGDDSILVRYSVTRLWFDKTMGDRPKDGKPTDPIDGSNW